MDAIVVLYQAKADRADENQQLIEALFVELDERQPDGFTYKVFRLEDDVSFIHVVIEHDIADPVGAENSSGPRSSGGECVLEPCRSRLFGLNARVGENATGPVNEGSQAAGRYSLMRPPHVVRRRIVGPGAMPTTFASLGARWFSDRWGRWVL